MAPSVLDYIGDVGGLNEIVYVFFGLFLNYFSAKRTYSILMNRLFHLTGTLEEGKEALRDL
jgi:hypothetical protein